MPISTQQLQHAAHYIVDLCKYRTIQFDTDELSKSDKHHLYECLYNVLLGLQRERHITINPYQKSMKAFRQYLGENQILFPVKTTIEIYGNGKTTCKGEVIYSFNEEKNKAARNRARAASTSVVETIRRSSSSVLSDSSSSIQRESSNDVVRSIKRTSSDSALSINRSSSNLEANTLTFQFAEFSIRRSKSTVSQEMGLNDPQSLKRITPRSN